MQCRGAPFQYYLNNVYVNSKLPCHVSIMSPLRRFSAYIFYIITASCLFGTDFFLYALTVSEEHFSHIFFCFFFFGKASVLDKI